MRLFSATLGVTLPPARRDRGSPAAAQPTPPAQRALQRALKQGLGKTGHQTGALVCRSDYRPDPLLPRPRTQVAFRPRSRSSIRHRLPCSGWGRTAHFHQLDPWSWPSDPRRLGRGLSTCAAGAIRRSARSASTSPGYGTGTGTTMPHVDRQLCSGPPGSPPWTAGSSGTSPTGTRSAGRRRPDSGATAEVEGELSALAYDRGFTNNPGHKRSSSIRRCTRPSSSKADCGPLG